MKLSKKEKPLIAFTIEQCSICKKEKKRPFQEGDYLFMQIGSCDVCKMATNIARIFGEPTK
ncbi:MAG: hypothetical protein ACKO7N_00475 [Candidatus Nitrosotenuis sp.]|jgi:hypothetical protein